MLEWKGMTLFQRQSLLESICTTAADYRAGELTPPTPEHVDRWVRQFESDAHLPLLKELDHLLKATYFSRRSVKAFLKKMLHSAKLTGGDPKRFWRRAHFLDIQSNGESQSAMLRLVDRTLSREFGFGLSDCGQGGGDYVYLDDVVFTGSRVRGDLSNWIKSGAPRKARLHVISCAVYTGSEWVFRDPLTKLLKKEGKDIDVQRWRSKEYENQKVNRDSSEVLWPATIPDNPLVERYLESGHRFPFEPRSARVAATPKIFSSEAGRRLLEQQMLIAGVRIRDFCKEPSDIMRPLGFGQFGLGFGSTIVTYRNCPNNSPLALWWGDPLAGPSHPFSKWYPLFPRKTYEAY